MKLGPQKNRKALSQKYLVIINLSIIPGKKSVGGGVGFYVSDDLFFKKIDDLAIMKEKVFESMFIDVDLGDRHIICGTVYRCPKSNHEEFMNNLQNVMKKCTKLNTNTILMGDLNYDLLNMHDTNINNCVDTFFDSGFYPLVNIPTRITDTSAKILDHCWTNITNMPVNSSVILEQISDHLPVFFNFQTDISVDNTFIEKRFFTEKNIEKFNISLKEMFVSDILKVKSTDSAYNIFIKRYLDIFEKSFPVKMVKLSKKRKNEKSWYNKDLENLNKVKQNNYKLHIENKSSNFLRRRYMISKHLYFRKCKEVKREYFRKHLLEVKNDSRGTWSVINSVLGRKKDRQLFKLSINGCEIKNEKKIANEFNRYFSSVAQNLVDKIPKDTKRKSFGDFLGERNPKSIFLHYTNPTEVTKILNALPAKTSSGWDEISQKLIKSSPFNVLSVLSHIFNLSLNEGVFPTKMKIAKVIPIFKKDSRENVENYRPISLLPVFSKLFERLVHRRLTKFLKRCNIIYEKQFGFRKNHSTSHATSYLSSEIYQSLEGSEKALCVFMDLSKAFDTINIDILIQKLDHYGVRGIANKWFKSYLTGRKQFVQINQHKSENVFDILHGVPQGSILGPVLFSLYINDFWKCLNSGEAVMFADDTTIIFKDKSVKVLCAKANSDLSSAANWLAENKLSLNIIKTKYMIFNLSK